MLAFSVYNKNGKVSRLLISYFFMTKFWKWVIVIVVIVVLAVLWSSRASLTGGTTSPVGSETVSIPSETDAAAMVARSGTSDEALDADLKAIDNAAGSLSSEVGAVDAGLNDQSLPLTE